MRQHSRRRRSNFIPLENLEPRTLFSTAPNLSVSWHPVGGVVAWDFDYSPNPEISTIHVISTANGLGTPAKPPTFYFNVSENGYQGKIPTYVDEDAAFYHPSRDENIQLDFKFAELMPSAIPSDHYPDHSTNSYASTSFYRIFPIDGQPIVSISSKFPTGTISIYENDQLVGTYTLGSGTPKFQPTNNSLGEHTLRFVYSGDNRYKPSETTATYTIVPPSVTTTLTSNVDAIYFGGTIELFANATADLPDANPLTGTFTFSIDGKVAGVVTNEGAKITTIPLFLPVGTHQVTVTYSGNEYYPASTSAPLTITVKQYPQPGTTGVENEPLFKEQTYLDRYSDVKHAVAKGIFASGWDHFINHGRAEGRNPSDIFNESQYRRDNYDVELAIAAGQFPSGYEHFRQFGQFENRAPHWGFIPDYYLRANEDVADAISAGVYKTAVEHYVLTGYKENRMTTQFSNPPGALPIIRLASDGYSPFIESKYFDMYPDVAAAVASDIYSSAFEHYIQKGRAEGRIPPI